MINPVLSIAYAPPIQYFCHLLKGAVVEQFENYHKQSYRNRCTILGSGGPISMTIPVQSGASSQCPITNVLLAPHNDWRKNHWHTICTCYGASPFFEYYAPDLESFFLAPLKSESLFDFNLHLLQTIVELLHLPIEVAFTEHYSPEAPNNLTHLLQPKSNWVDPHFSPTPYYQPFRERLGFVPNMSVLDLLFNAGPEAILVLQKSYRVFQ